ncbi:MAG TPA: ASKHA domain-containing protein, partial [Chloroflexota bacterium]|nr:ASKHA domain-containing protein [Chloroflexota bacterium]
DRVLLAGAFGSYVGAGAARAIGLIPPVPLDRVETVGNAAGRGSRMALTSTDARRRAETLARRVEYVELSSDTAFADAFMDAMCFPAFDALVALDEGVP